MSDDLVKRLLELRTKQYADSDTAPEFVFLDPDIPPSQWEKQYHMDVVYVRGDVMWLNLKEQAARIEELEAKHQEAFQMYVDANEARLDAEAKLAVFEGMKMIDFASYLNSKYLDKIAELTGGKDE